MIIGSFLEHLWASTVATWPQLWLSRLNSGCKSDLTLMFTYFGTVLFKIK